jgi:hypothetical protein
VLCCWRSAAQRGSASMCAHRSAVRPTALQVRRLVRLDDPRRRGALCVVDLRCDLRQCE